MRYSPQEPDGDQDPDHYAKHDQKCIGGRTVRWRVFFPVVSHDAIPHAKPALERCEWFLGKAIAKAMIARAKAAGTHRPTMAGTKAEQIPRIFPGSRRIVSVPFRLETSSGASTPVGKSL